MPSEGTMSEDKIPEKNEIDEKGIIIMLLILSSCALAAWQYLSVLGML